MNRILFSFLWVVGWLSVPVENCHHQDEPARNQPAAEEAKANDSLQRKYNKPAIIEFQGEIHGSLTRYFFNRFERAKNDGVDLLIIEIDSPGGSRDESLRMATALAKCTWADTVAFIPEQAISGGALVALGCDEIVVAEDASLGNIGEIALDPFAGTVRLIRPKIESSLGHEARQLAEAKGRPADLVEAFIDKDIVVYRRERPDGSFEHRQVMPEDAKPDETWEMIPETKPERFLTLSGKRAVELELAQRFAQNREELAEIYGIDLKRTKVYRFTGNDRMVHLLNDPWITGLIIAVGLIALYIELSAPGLGAGGLIAGLCILLFFWSRFLGGTAGWLEILLFAAGLTFILMEIFVIPGFGISGVLGIAMMFFSVVLASQNFTVPSTVEQWNQSANTVLVLMISFCIFLVAAVFISRHYGSIPILNRLVLDPGSTSGEDSEGTSKKAKPVPVSHPLVSVGDWGVAESLLRPAGRAKFAGRSIDVISDGAFVDAGKQVKVIRINGNVITVSEIEEENV